MDQKQQKYRKVVFYDNRYQEFFSRQSKKVKAKIVWTIELIEDLPWIPETYLKYIVNTDGLYEIRVQLGSDIFRIFCFFDEPKLVILINGFQKKSQKTPRQEIELALKIKLEYEKEKREINGP
jgi:phage-related protein